MVSILMVVHNGEAHLPETLDTLLDQTLKEFELIIVDDGSSDATGEILAAYSSRDPRIVLLRNEARQGISAATNRGLAECRAPLVARADADDLYDPDRLRIQYEYMLRNPEIDLIGTAYHKIDGGGRHLNTFYPPTENHQIQLALRLASCFCHPSVMFRTEAIRQVGGYNVQFWTAVDFELWTRLRGRIRMANLPIPLVRYRRHGGSITHRRGAPGSEMSRSITQRELSKLLDREVAKDEVVAVLAFNNRRRLKPEQVPSGVRTLSEFLARTTEVEDPRAVAEFRGRMAREFMSRSREFRDADRAIGRFLFYRSILWDVRQLADLRTWKHALRLFLPTRADEERGLPGTSATNAPDQANGEMAEAGAPRVETNVAEPVGRMVAEDRE